ncbi:metal-dependent hydrolase [Phenylobacterium sp.]|uniref:metal-dependent hydrolase n=1 Tax=Phenylobacterium sp. TaxID=1871053 RepID=UPI002FCA9CC2
MFVGHYAASLAAKAIEPRAPLWTYVIGAQLIDIGWGALVMAGVEKVRIDPSLPGSSLDLYHMPYTHSLPAVVLWSLAAALAVRFVLRLPTRAAVFVGLAVFSHWILDLVVHRPDLELWFGDGKVGFGLWNYPVPEQAVEIGLLALGAAAWAWLRGRNGQALWPVLLFVTVLVAVQITAMVMPGGGDSAGLGGMAIAIYLVIGLIAWALDRTKPAA